MIELSSNNIKAYINKKGAELSSFYQINSSIEYVWQADPAIWPWHAPNLFPIVGGLVNNELYVDGNAYSLQRHGFARHSDFVLIESSGSHAIFSLRYNEDTLLSYPYHFEFQLIYHLQDSNLTCTYKVINLESKTIWFSLGGHPAFNAPFFPDEKYEDYFLEFDQDELLLRHHLSAAGYFNNETSSLTLDDKKLWLKPDLFQNDALVFKQLQSREVTLRSKNHTHSLTVSFADFNSLGIWAKPNAPFVCIEPWLGYADNESSNKASIQEKEGIVSLLPGHVFEASYSITVNS
jgi:galactose mutarotase-like enzyme